MQIVIDIPEEEYRRIMKSDKTVFANVASKECMLHAIKNGTPLPKGHGRLIDETDLWFEDIDDIPCVTQRNVESAPTIIEADTTESED